MPKGRPVPTLLILAAVAGFVLLTTGKFEPTPRSPAAPHPAESAPPEDAGRPVEADPGHRGPPSITGLVRVNGAPPEYAVTLRAWTREPGSTTDRSVETDGDGRFAFRGLPEGWRGHLSVPGDHLFPDGGRVLDVTVPARDLLLAITRLPRLSGRVRDADGAPREGATVRLFWSKSDGSAGSIGGATGEDGRFRLVLPAGELASARLEIDAFDGAASITRSLDPERLASDLDLGDLDLPAVREITLVVTDGSGRPCPTAAAAIEGTYRAVRARGDGRIRLTLPIARIGVRVRATGQVGKLVEVPATARGELPILLERGCLLRIGPRERDGDTAEGVEVVVTAENPITESEDGDIDFLDVEAGATPPASGAFGTRYEFRWRYDGTGRVVIPRVRPDNPIRIQVLDRLTGASLADAEVILSPGEWKRFDPVVSVPGRLLQVTVVDESGEGLGGASVLVTADGAEGRRREDTYPGGYARIGGIRTGRVRLRIDRHDRVPEARVVDVPPEGIQLRFVLRGGLSVKVRVVDEAGSPIEPDEVWARADGDRIAGRALTEGVHLVPNLPPGLVTIRVRWAGRILETKHDSRQPEARIVVPTAGTVRVGIPFGLDAGAHRLRLIPADDRGAEVTLDLFERAMPDDRTLRFEPVLPGTYRALLEVEAELRDAMHTHDRVGESGDFVVEPGREARVEVTR